MADLEITFTKEHVRAVRKAELERKAFLGGGACLEGIYLEPEMQAASEAMRRGEIENAKVSTERADSTPNMAPRTDVPRI
jgi:hypothetical protein